MYINLEDLVEWLSSFHTSETTGMSKDECKNYWRSNIISRFGHTCKVCFHCHSGNFCDIKGIISDVNQPGCSSWCIVMNPSSTV